jgi:hypothetical protein
MSKVVTIEHTPTGTVLRWVAEGQVLRFAGRLPEQWLEVIRQYGYTMQAATKQAA